MVPLGMQRRICTARAQEPQESSASVLDRPRPSADKDPWDPWRRRPFLLRNSPADSRLNGSLASSEDSETPAVPQRPDLPLSPNNERRRSFPQPPSSPRTMPISTAPEETAIAVDGLGTLKGWHNPEDGTSQSVSGLYNFPSAQTDSVALPTGTSRFLTPIFALASHTRR
jgi:hypothetical protein